MGCDAGPDAGDGLQPGPAAGCRPRLSPNEGGELQPGPAPVTHARLQPALAAASIAASLAFPALAGAIRVAVPALAVACLASWTLSLAYLSWFDIRTRRLPTRFVWPLAAVGFALMLAGETLHCAGVHAGFGDVVAWAGLGSGSIAAQAPIVSSALQSLAGGALALLCAVLPLAVMRLRGQPSSPDVAPVLGRGDVRLMVVLGISLGEEIIPVLAVGCILGLLVALATRSRTFAFGPCLAVPAVASMLLRLLL